MITVKAATHFSKSGGPCSNRSLIAHKPDGHGARQVLADSPADRIGNPDELAAAVEYLTGPAAGHVTGSDLLLDGGAVAAMRWTDLEPEDPTDASPQVKGPA